MPRAGIEPARLAARDFESRASTYSAISATHKRDYDRISLFLQAWCCVGRALGVFRECFSADIAGDEAHVFIF